MAHSMFIDDEDTCQNKRFTDWKTSNKTNIISLYEKGAPNHAKRRFNPQENRIHC